MLPGDAIVAWDPGLLLVVAPRQKAEAKGHVPDTCASAAWWPDAPGSRAGSFPSAGFVPELLHSCFLVYRWKQRSAWLPLISLSALLPARGRQIYC